MPSSSEPNSHFIEAALAASEDCIKIIGLDGTLQFMSEGGRRVMEVDDFEVLKGCHWPSFWHDEGNAAAIAALADAREGRSARFTGFANTAKGNRRFWDVKVSPIFAKDGSIENILSVSRDITALKAFEEQQQLLRGELSHRIKNILTMAQSIAGQTLKEGDDMSVARPALLARLAALGRAHDILMNSDENATTMQAVAETILHVQQPGRIDANGPPVALSAKSGLAIALTLHELATNAVKYGALSNDAGHVFAIWGVDKAEAGDQFYLHWEERGGPTVARPRQKGFGSRMIERALTGYVNGKTELDYRPTGIVFRLTAPLATLMETKR